MSDGMLYLMTDKEATKDVECSTPGCLNWCRVTKFYSASKAKCPTCGGDPHMDEPIDSAPDPVTTSSKPSTGKITTSTPVAQQPENHKLGKLCCPLCGRKMDILSVHNAGWVTFSCKQDRTVVDIVMDWRAMVVRSVPKEFRPFVKAFHEQNDIPMDSAVSRMLGVAT